MVHVLLKPDLKNFEHYFTSMWDECNCVVVEVKTSACNAGDLGSIPGKIPWRRKWQPTPVFLPGEFHGQRSLAGYSPQGHKESDTTERLHWLTHSTCHITCARCSCNRYLGESLLCWKNCCFRTMVLEKTLESPLDSRDQTSQSLKEINPECSLEGLMLKLRYFGHVIWRADSLGKKTLMLGKIEGRGEEGNRVWDGWVTLVTE